tara:strand:- start:6496 stop:8430 length:1935 start_codon:yes stop_codon:yes gene_type:complete
MAKIDEDFLSGVVARELSTTEEYTDTALADEQARNLNYYYGNPRGDEEAGFSQVVTRDVLETVEGIMPELMKIFTAGDNAVQFEPEGAEDLEAANQATDYLNYVFNSRMGGFSILYNWFKDALLMKNGIIKVGWAEEDRVEFHRFKDVTQEELELFEDDDEIEEIDAEENEDGTFDVRVSRIVTKGKPVVDLIPSEEFKIKQRSVSIAEADFVAHVPSKSLGSLIEDGFDEDLVLSLGGSDRMDDDIVSDARFSDPDEQDPRDDAIGEMEKEVEVIDAYVKLFDEDDNRVKIFHVIQVGTTVLDFEEVEKAPFISLSPMMMPHKFTGICPADLVTDIQEIRTQLYRNTLDNLALSNAGRYTAVEGQVNLADLQKNGIGQIVRMKVQGAVGQLPTPQLSAATLPFLSLLDTEKENRVGVSRMTQGLDSNALTSNTAATAVNQVMSAAQQKILLIARVFAETGVKDLFWELYRLVRTHQNEKDIVKLRGKFVEVAPFDWYDRYDMKVTVGIGNGNKDQQLYHLNNITQMLQSIGNTPYSYMITPQNVYNTALETIKNSGYKNPEMFLTDPSTIQPPEPQPSPEMIEAQTNQMEAQAKAQKEQGEMQLKQQQLQLDVAKFEWQKKVDAVEAGLEASQGRAVGIGDGK